MAYSPEKHNSIEKLVKVSNLTKETFSLLWKIEQFRECMDRKYEFPSSTYSPESPLKTKWRMVLFPKFIYPEGQYIALRLLKVSDDDISYSVVYTVSIIDGKGQYFLKQTREKVFHCFLDFDECFVISNREIKEENLLPNGSLTVNCKIELIVLNNQPEESSTQAPPHYDSVVKCDVTSVEALGKKQIEYERNESIPKMNAQLRIDREISLKRVKQEQTQKSIELLSEDFKSFYMSKYQTDMKIRVDDGELRAHRSILAARSEYFRQAMAPFIDCPDPDIYIPEIKKGTLDTVLYYLYSGKLRALTYQTAMDILLACKILRLDKLQDEVQNFLKSQITVENVTDIIRISKEMQMDSLKNSALKFVSINHAEVTKTEKWYEIIRDDPHSAGEVLLTVASFRNSPYRN